MATPYDVVDNSFLTKISDDYLPTIEEEKIEMLVDRYRLSALPRFKQCKKLQNRDDDLRQFNDDLTDEEIEIVANLMIVEWLRPFINHADLLKQKMATKDYRVFSSANHIESIRKLKEEIELEVSRMIISYTYSTNSLDDLAGGR